MANVVNLPCEDPREWKHVITSFNIRTLASTRDFVCMEFISHRNFSFHFNLVFEKINYIHITFGDLRIDYRNPLKQALWFIYLNSQHIVRWSRQYCPCHNIKQAWTWTEYVTSCNTMVSECRVVMQFDVPRNYYCSCRGGGVGCGRLEKCLVGVGEIRGEMVVILRAFHVKSK